MPRDLLEAFSEYLYAELRYLRQVAAPGYSIDRKSAFQEAIQKLLLRMDDLLVEEEAHVTENHAEPLSPPRLGECDRPDTV